MIKHAISTDWVEVNLLCGHIEKWEKEKFIGDEKNKLLFKKAGIGTRFFKSKFDIFHEKRSFGHLLCNPRDGSILNKNLLQLKVLNNRLYEIGWLDTLKTIMKAADFKYHGTSRLDIAVDGGEFFKLFEEWNSGKIDKLGKASVIPYFTSKRKLEGYECGKRSSEKMISCYNKSEELKRTGKYYIKKWWKKVDLEIGDRVERLELRMSNDELKKYQDYDFGKLDDFEHLATLMKSGLHKFFEFIIPSQKKTFLVPNGLNSLIGIFSGVGLWKKTAP